MRSRALKRGVMAILAAFLSIGIMFLGQPAEILGAAPEGGQASSNAKLKSLSVSTGTMSPEFSPETTSYTITVADDVEKINVTCSTDDINAQVVEAGGFKNLKPGSNNAIITVMAADGTKCTYNLTIIRGSAGTGIENEGAEGESGENPNSDSQPENENSGTDAEGETEAGEEPDAMAVPTAGSADLIPVGGDSIFAPFQVHSTYPAELLPDGFVSAEYNYKGYAVQSAYFAAGDVRLLYLSAMDGGSADFRIYYEDTDVFMDFLQLKGTDGKFIMPIRYMAQIKIPDNYTGSFMPWDDKVISCFIYTELTDLPIKAPGETENDEGEDASTEEEPVRVEDLEKEPEFYLLFAMNNEGGENFYLYDYVEGTYQRYVERDTSYELDQSYFKYKDMAHQRFAVMCVLIVLLIIAVFCIVNLWMQNRELKKEFEDDDESEDEPDTEKKAVKNVKKKPVEKKERARKEENPEKKERTQKAEKPEKKERPVKTAAEKKERASKTEEKPVREKKAVKEVKPVKQEVDTDSLEEKIIGQLQETEKDVRRAPVTTARKPSNFKMINLSREPGPTGIDDDFEFEFINFDDE